MNTQFCLLLLLHLCFQQPIQAANEDFSVVRSFDASNAQGAAYGVAVDDQDGSVYFWGHRNNIARLTKLAANNTVLWSLQFVNQSFAGFNLVTGPNPVIDYASRHVFIAGTTTTSFDWQQIQPKIRPVDSLIDNRLEYNLGYIENFFHALWISGPNVLFMSSSTVSNGSQASGMLARSTSDLVSWKIEGWWRGGNVKAYVWSPYLQMMAIILSDNSINSGPNLFYHDWVRRTAPSRIWTSMAWSEELRLFVAVAKSGSGDRVMTSNNGVNWTIGQSAADSEWNLVIWAKAANRFLALSPTHAMISANGFNWTAQALANSLDWSSACYSADLGLFVAVAQSGQGNRAMTSTDGIGWTLRSTPGNCSWRHVIWVTELNLFVAVGSGGAPNERVMTSPNGIDWFPRPSRDIDYYRALWLPSLSKLLLFGSGFVEIFEPSAETIFVSRLSNLDGTPIWTKFYGDAAVTRVYSMDQTNSSLIIGGTTVGNFYTSQSISDNDCLLFAVSKNSNAVEWTQIFGTVASDGVLGVLVSRNLSSIYTTGWTSGNMSRFNAGSLDIFVSRHSINNGSQILVSSYGSAGEDAGLSLAINQAGSALYLAGYASGAVRMNDNSIVSVAHDQMIASLDPITLNMTWSRFIGGLGFSDRAVGIAIHPQTDLIYSSGFISSSIVNSGSNFQKTSYGNYDLTLTALHPNGTILWTRVAGSNLDDQGGGLAFNSNGVLFVAARINNSDGYLVHTLDSSGNNSFQKPNLTVNLPSFSSCYSNPWISTSTRTLFSIFTSYSFFTLACTPTTNVLTQINSLGYLTITETVYQSLIVTAGGSNEGSAGANSIDLTSNSTFVIMIALISLCLLMSAIIITLMWRKNSSSHDKNSDIRLLSPSGGVLPQSIFGEPVRRDSSFSPPTQIAANNLTATAYSSVNYQSYTDGTTRTE